MKVSEWKELFRTMETNKLHGTISALRHLRSACPDLVLEVFGSALLRSDQRKAYHQGLADSRAVSNCRVVERLIHE